MPKISEYFKDHELTCPCGCGLMPDDRSIDMLYAGRIIINVPLSLNSAARCLNYNRSIGSSDSSTHLKGAFDIRTYSTIEIKLVQVMLHVGFIGLGFKDNSFLHIDRYKERMWGY